ncbi:MAG: hypothetical protein MUE36_10475 [Acidimicrobiales bacterium]|jgi:hypothetical protein|nr:hypothetical protein [Acidimicrobiales bacterium]
MAEVVWVTSWEIQCCGDPIAVGELVAWTATRNIDLDYLGWVIGPTSAAEVTAAEEHHVPDEDWIEISGKVESIESVLCEFAPKEGVRYPVAGTAVITSVDRADGWESEPEDLVFVGYRVRLS